MHIQLQLATGYLDIQISDLIPRIELSLSLIHILQVEAIKHQGSRTGEEDKDAGKRSTQVVGDRNGMNYKHCLLYTSLPDQSGGSAHHRFGARHFLGSAQLPVSLTSSSVYRHSQSSAQSVKMPNHP